MPYTSGSWSVVPTPAASASPGTWKKCEFSDLIPGQMRPTLGLEPGSEFYRPSGWLQYIPNFENHSNYLILYNYSICWGFLLKLSSKSAGCLSWFSGFILFFPGLRLKILFLDLIFPNSLTHLWIDASGIRTRGGRLARTFHFVNQKNWHQGK